MSTLPNTAAMVESCRIYGTLNPGALYGRMKMESEGNPNRWYAIRAAVAGYITANDLRDVDGIYNSEQPFSNVVPVPVPSPVPVLLMPVVTTPTDAGGLVFPRPDAPMAEQEAFYNGAAYQAYIAARQQATAGYGFDSIFDNYVLNAVISYEANNNLAGAMDYIQQIAAYQNQQLSNNVVLNLSQKGYDITPSEAAYLLSGGQLTMVQSGTGTLISVDRFLDPNAIVVTAARISNPPNAIYSPGFLSMLSTGLAFTPISVIGGATPAPTEQLRAMSASEKGAMSRIFGNSVSLEKVTIIFGDGGSLIAKRAFANGNPAITLGNTIYFNSLPHEFTSVADLANLAHEMTHVRQYQTLGWFAVISGVAIDAAAVGQVVPYQYWTRTLGYQYEMLEGKAQIVQDYVAFRESNGAVLPNYITAERLEIMATGSGVYGK